MAGAAAAAVLAVGLGVFLWSKNASAAPAPLPSGGGGATPPPTPLPSGGGGAPGSQQSDGGFTQVNPAQQANTSSQTAVQPISGETDLTSSDGGGDQSL